MRNRLSSQVLLGGLIVLIGVVLLVETVTTVDLSGVLTYVPSLFVLLGAYAIVSSGFRNLIGPVIVILVAGAWQLVALGYLEADEVVQFWPLLIVLLGLSIILGQYRSRAAEVESGYVSALGIFGANEQRAAGTFEGADLTAVFGGVELDLRDAAVEHPPAQVSATALFGGVDVVVPREWNVTVDVLPIFGGAEDDRPRRADEHDEVDLLVTGFVAFGGISVTD